MDDAPALVVDFDSPLTSTDCASNNDVGAVPLETRADEIVAPDAAQIDLPLRIVEALLFASDVPLSAGKLVELVGAGTTTTIRLAIAALNDQYTAAGLAFRIEEIARGYQFMTLAEFKPYLVKLNRQRAETRLSDAALETLSIIAYKQPVIRADIEAIRGVACGDQIARLRELGLVRLVGRAEIVGRPMLYGTTRKFLDMFGLADLDDLPPMEALKLRPAAKPKLIDSPAADRDDSPASAARRPIVDDRPVPQASAGA